MSQTGLVVNLVQRAWSLEFPALVSLWVLFLSLASRFSFLLSRVSFPSRLSITYHSLFLSFSFLPSPLVLSWSFSPLIFSFASIWFLTPILLPLPFPSILYLLFPRQKYFPGKVDLVYSVFSCSVPSLHPLPFFSCGQDFVNVPLNLTPISNTHGPPEVWIGGHLSRLPMKELCTTEKSSKTYQLAGSSPFIQPVVSQST